MIWSASQALGCRSASIHELYLARGRGEFDATGSRCRPSTSAPSTYLTARQAFAAAIERDAGAVIFEIAKSEMAYTDQRPAEYTAVILAAAMRSGWQGPVFLQGDHFQFNATKWRDDPDAEMAGLKELTSEAIGGRIPEHRHRQQHAGRPVAAGARRRSRRSTPPTRWS